MPLYSEISEVLACTGEAGATRVILGGDRLVTLLELVPLLVTRGSGVSRGS